MTHFVHPPTEALKLESVLYALGDPIRLRIVQALAEGGELACNAAVAGLDLAKSTQSHHFRILRETGIVRTRKEGVCYLTTLRRDDLEARFPGLLDAVLASARQRENAAEEKGRVSDAAQ